MCGVDAILGGNERGREGERKVKSHPILLHSKIIIIRYYSGYNNMYVHVLPKFNRSL